MDRTGESPAQIVTRLDRLLRTVDQSGLHPSGVGFLEWVATTDRAQYLQQLFGYFIVLDERVDFSRLPDGPILRVLRELRGNGDKWPWS